MGDIENSDFLSINKGLQKIFVLLITSIPEATEIAD